MLFVFLTCIIINSHICKYVYNDNVIIKDIVSHYDDINHIDLYYNNMRYFSHNISNIIDIFPKDKTDINLEFYINYNNQHQYRDNEPYLYMFIKKD